MTDTPACPHHTPAPREDAPELFTWEFATDPYPAYAWLREHAPCTAPRCPAGSRRGW